MEEGGFPFCPWVCDHALWTILIEVICQVDSVACSWSTCVGLMDFKADTLFNEFFVCGREMELHLQASAVDSWEVFAKHSIGLTSDYWS